MSYVVKSIRYNTQDWLEIEAEMQAEGYSEYSKWIKKLIDERQELRQRFAQAQKGWAEFVNPLSRSLHLPELPIGQINVIHTPKTPEQTGQVVSK